MKRIVSIRLKQIYESHSKNEFERRMYYESSRDVDIGNLCHSKEYATTIDKAFYSLLHQTMIQFFTQIDQTTKMPHPWTLILDGSTFQRREAQVIKFIV